MLMCNLQSYATGCLVMYECVIAHQCRLCSYLVDLFSLYL